MKYSHAVALLLGSSLATSEARYASSNDLKDAEDVFKGVLMGALNVEFKNVEECVQDAESTLKDVEQAYNHFKSKDVADVIEGLKDVGHALMDIKNAMSDCKSIEGDFKKLAEMAVVFSNPESAIIHIGKDIIIHGKDIYKETKAAIKDYESSPRDYYDFGYNIGEAAAQVIIGSEGQLALTHLRQKEQAQVLQGILKSYGGHFNLDALLTCVKDEGQAILILNAAVKAFEGAWETKSLQDIIAGVVALVGFVQSFRAGLPACEAIDTSSFDYASFSSTIDIAAHPMSHFKILKDDLHLDGVSVLKNVHNGVHAYKHSDYEQFGELMGQVLKMASDHKVADQGLVEATEDAIRKEKNMYLY